MRTAGERRLAEYLAAPQAVRDTFDHQVREQAQALHDFEHWISGVELDTTPPDYPTTSLPRHPVRWDETWSRRARRRGRANGHEPDHDPLRDVSMAEAVERLVGEQIPPSGLICCPLPGHDDRSPSFKVYENDFYCFGCRAGGTIYDLARELSGIGDRGEQFNELRRWLARELLGAAA